MQAPANRGQFMVAQSGAIFKPGQVVRITPDQTSIEEGRQSAVMSAGEPREQLIKRKCRCGRQRNKAPVTENIAAWLHYDTQTPASPPTMRRSCANPRLHPKKERRQTRNEKRMNHDDRGNFGQSQHTISIDDQSDFSNEQDTAQYLKKWSGCFDRLSQTFFAHQRPDDGNDQVEPVTNHHDKPHRMIHDEKL